MAYEIVNIGSAPNSKDGDTARAAFKKVNNNFAKIFEVLTPVNFQEISADTILTDVSAEYLVDTSVAAITVALPSEPTVGTKVSFYDSKGSFTLRPLTIQPNGQRINGAVSGPVVRNAAFTKATFVFISSEAGWILS